MACPGGCIGGGGTSRGPAWSRTLPVRQEAVYDEDAAMTVKSSHENPDVARLYREYLGTPGSRLAHDLCTRTTTTAARPRRRRFSDSSS